MPTVPCALIASTGEAADRYRRHVGFTAIGVAVVRRIGVLLLGLAVIAGQLTGALVLDLVAPGPAGAPGLTAFLGVGLTLVAVLVVVVRDRT